MLIFMVRRFGTMVLTMLVVSILVFSLLEINIDSVATKVLGPYSSQEQRHLWLVSNGYYEPAVFRYFYCLASFVVVDFVYSVRFMPPFSFFLFPRLSLDPILLFSCLFFSFLFFFFFFLFFLF